MNHIQIVKDTTFLPQLQNSLTNTYALSSWDAFNLSYEAELATMNHSFDELKSLAHLPQIEFLPYQLDAAKRVLFKMDGRAILADEVGLGKTIEAGLVLKEYIIRGLVKKAIILVPSSLVSQWVEELRTKFNINAIAYRKNYRWEDIDVVVCSLDMAKKSPHHEDITNIPYDFLLVDEAHRLKNVKTLNNSFVRNIQKKYCLFLTATPIQNSLSEIYHLVSILRPGLLGSYDAFIQAFEDKEDEQKSILNQLIQQVIIRNTRKDIQQTTIKRHVETQWIEFTTEEQNVYDRIDNLASHLPPFTKLTLLRALCSSREACFLSIEKMLKQQDHPYKKELVEIADEISVLPHHAKAKKAMKYISSIGDEKVIIFTEYRATQFYLQWYLQQHGITSVPFRGGFKGTKKDWMKQLFEHHAQVLITTAAGGEGINLQFCHHLINYDLPWNPMKIEQRIGRIHRYGQENDVHITHIALKNTLEDRLMHILYDKVHLFERVIGRVDDILSILEIPNIDQEIQTILKDSDSESEVKQKLHQLTSIIEQETTQSEDQHYGRSES